MMQHAPLWTGQDLAAATGGKLVGGDFEAGAISIDTRTLKPGDLFIALTGPQFNGHNFIDNAFEKGAAAVVVSQPTDKGKYILVADTLRALEDMGAAARARSTAKIFAVTGSVGKTSTKEMLARCLALLGETHASKASLNNQWGVPLSLARMPIETQFGVFEVGMNHAGEIAPLSQMMSPHIGLITTIASAHIEHLGSLENIARAKAELFQGMDAQGTVILPRDSAQFPVLLAEARTHGIQNILSFGHEPHSELRMLNVHAHADKTDMRFRFKDKEYTVTLGVAGVHHAMNALAVLGAVAQITDAIETVFPALEEMEPVHGRGNRWACVLKAGAPPLLVIDETHNASPIAVRAALDVLAQIPTTGRRLVALGDMLELGETSVKEHASLKEPLLAAHVDQVFTCGKLMAHLAEALPFGRNRHFADSAILAAQIGELVLPGDILLVKGSRGSKMRLVIDALQLLSQSAQSAVSHALG